MTLCKERSVSHGFRKFYKTHAEQAMRPIDAEITMVHNIGISASYYKPKESKILEDYLLVVDLLTIKNDTIILDKQVAEPQRKSKDNRSIHLENLRKYVMNNARWKRLILIWDSPHFI